MFWGLIMEPNKRYTQVVDKPFHISHAAMDISTGDTEPCQVMVVVEGKNFLVCTLQQKHSIQMPLDLYFKCGENVSFLTNGKCNIHLTGYVDPDLDDLTDDEEGDEETYEELEAKVMNHKRKLEATSESAVNKAKKGKKIASGNDDSSDSDNNTDQLQKFLNGEDIDSDDNDESFKVNTSGDADESDDEESDDDEDDAEEEEGDNEEEEADTSKASSVDTSKNESQIDLSKLTKNQKKRLKKKLQKEKQMNGVDKAKKDKTAPQKQEKKPEGKKDKETPEVPKTKKEKKSLSGGVIIEDLKVGAGAVAKPGKTVMVYYEGRLKQTNAIFDDCKKGAGFKFRLGAKEVIAGWDVGVSGMKVGGKRKIICPPSMAYGAKGSAPVIPPNSTLVFEVELKNVK